MPESPEVKYSVEILRKHIQNKSLLKVAIIGGKFTKTLPLNFDSFNLQLPLTFENVRCKGKMLIFDFKDTKMKMFAGLGMTGQFVFYKDSHSALEFTFEDIVNTSEDTLERSIAKFYFNDMRRFGNIIFSTVDESSRIAPSILSCGDEKEISQTEFLSRGKALQKRTSRDVTTVLMDQTEKTGVCSGIGNYLVAEILYHSGINPFRKFKSLSEEELIKIHGCALRISLDSYNNQGMTVSDFISPEGKEGTYQKFLHVYSRKMTPDGDIVVSEKGGHGRTIWWVPSKQT